MSCDSGSFLSATDAQTGSRDYSTIFKEICAIQQAILLSVSNHTRIATVPNMTSSSPATYAWQAVAVPKTNVNGTVYLQTAPPSSAFAGDIWISPSPTGTIWHTAAKAATTFALTTTYANGTAGVGATLTATANGAIILDAITLSVNDRILVKNQTLPQENGIYVVTATGDISNPFVLTRATDLDAPSEVVNAAIFVENGTVNSNTGWIVSSAVNVMGTDPLLWGILVTTTTGLLYTKIYTNTAPLTTDVITPMTTVADANSDGKPDSYIYYDVVNSIITDISIQDQIDYVTKYFTDLGYTVQLLNNPATNSTLQWKITW